MVELSRLMIYFSIYSFLGWVWETSFVSICTGKFVNRGFLKGFFIPIYGLGALSVIMVQRIIGNTPNSYIFNLFIVVIVSTLVVTTLEFLTGFTMEKIFNKKWWDYSDKRFNLKGYICLKFTLGWGVFIFIFLLLLHPNISYYIASFNEGVIVSMAIIFTVYLIADVILSTKEVISLREAIRKYAEVPFEKYRMSVIKYRRIFNAFPYLLKLNAGSLKFDVRSILNESVEKFKTQIVSRFR
ncbi:putative ABC transporter permease [Vallitalea sediminicola]